MNQAVQKLKKAIADLTPEEMVFVDEFKDAVVTGDEEKQYQMWRGLLMGFDELSDGLEDNPFAQQYLKELNEERALAGL